MAISANPLIFIYFFLVDFFFFGPVTPGDVMVSEGKFKKTDKLKKKKKKKKTNNPIIKKKKISTSEYE